MLPLLASTYIEDTVKEAGSIVPVVPDNVPQQGNRVTRAFGRTGLRLLGWRVTGRIPDLDKFVVVVAPHTTGWDFPIAMVTLLALGVRASWLGVDWIFRYPMMRVIGGIPVDRSKGGGIVRHAIREFGRREHYILGLSPEGSRKKVVPWKTGFYRIATGAKVPLLLCSFDQGKKTIHLGTLFEPSGDYEADMEQHIRPFYAEYVERYPDNFGM